MYNVDTSGIESQQQRERLEMLKLILGNSNSSNNCSIPGTTRLQPFPSSSLSSPSIKYDYANHSNLTTTGEKFSEVLWMMLTFVFAFIGDAIIWSAAAFQESRLPELPGCGAIGDNRPLAPATESHPRTTQEKGRDSRRNNGQIERSHSLERGAAS